MSSLRAIALTPSRRTIVLWLTTSLMICIGVLMFLPLGLPDVAGSDKDHHILAFAALVLPCAALYPRGIPRVILGATAYGALIEIIQPFVGRSGDFIDFTADLAGMGLGSILGLGIYHAVESCSGFRRRAVQKRATNVIQLYNYRTGKAIAEDSLDP
ncbi:hypothetical protein [Sulfitobacter sp. W074]|uniref:hypothetical protein n=1 Tax=Sulfitobacter sp. W074 TaxID=2867026 RepID=UPI0021A3B72C|nr:hypothetical protein [Sulfitobacter sp. W074]UWR39444.1 hypothetical protein K3762_19000 [Sulfitobacter sp. W074]